MRLNEKLVGEYRTLTDAKERQQFVNMLLSTISEMHRHDAGSIAVLTSERNVLTDKVSRASALIEAAQHEAEHSRKAAISETRKKLQIVRDRLHAITTTVKALEQYTNERPERDELGVMYGNIVASVRIIAEELAAAGLWDTDEDQPTGLETPQVEDGIELGGNR